jgi:ABC-2 type transport system ATP-binding protein
MNPIIDIQSLSKTFKGKNKNAPVVALRDVTLQVEPGKVFGFVGPNGAGKSTAIKILMGFIKASNGSASLCSIPVTSEYCRKKVGYLPENPVFHGFLTAREVLETTAALRGLANDFSQEDISLLLDKVNLLNDTKRPVHGFSKGMTQRLGIANSLVGNPELLIFDEPMSGLDPLGRDLVRGLMLELREQGKTIFFSSHILHDVETICDEVAILLQGELVFLGDLGEITGKQQGDDVSIQFKADKVNNDLNKSLKQQRALLTNLSANIFQLTLPQQELSPTVQKLLDQQCQIIHIQQNHSSLESFFMQLVNSKKDGNYSA